MKMGAGNQFPSATSNLGDGMRRAVLEAANCFCIRAYAATAGQIMHLADTLSAKRADGTGKLLAVKADGRGIGNDDAAACKM